MYQILISQSVRKSIQSLPHVIRKRIIHKIELLESNPRPKGVIKLQGSDNHYRIKVGDYRVIYRIKDNLLCVIILRVAHRRESYQ